MSQACLSVKGLHKSFGAGVGAKAVLEDFSAIFAPAALTILSGRSGSGKTTLLSLIGLLDTPDSGDIRIGDTNPLALSARKRARFRRQTFSYIFQRTGLIDGMSIRQNLLLPLRYRRGLPAASRSKDHLLAAMEQAAIDLPLSRRTANLSGGERMRIAMARALVVPFDILLCDEPTAALDTESSHAIGKTLQQLSRQGKTVIIASHDPLMHGYADSVIDLEAV